MEQDRAWSLFESANASLATVRLVDNNLKK